MHNEAIFASTKRVVFICCIVLAMIWMGGFILFAKVDITSISADLLVKKNKVERKEDLRKNHLDDTVSNHFASFSNNKKDQIHFLQTTDSHAQKTNTNKVFITEETSTAFPPKIGFTKDVNVNETDDMFMRRLETRMKSRRNSIQEACKELGINPKKTSSKIWSIDLSKPQPKLYMAEKYGLIYCPVPKSGVTNWKKVIAVLNRLQNETKDIKHVDYPEPFTRKGLNSHLLNSMYDNSTKVLVVRNPMERLVSAYFDKLYPKPPALKPAFHKFSVEVAKKYRNDERIKMLSNNISTDGQKETPKRIYATFDEFVSYLLDPENENDLSKDNLYERDWEIERMNIRHWQSFHSLCYPCHIDYDIIGHTETIEEDSRYALKLIGAQTDLRYPEGYGKSGTSSTTSTKVKDLLFSMDKEKVKKLLKKYKTDYDIFGYNVPEYLTAYVQQP